MTKQERQAHLRKRDSLKKAGVRFVKQKHKKISFKAYFTYSKFRPLLKNMSEKTRMQYLRAIIVRAKMRSIE